MRAFCPRLDSKCDQMSRRKIPFKWTITFSSTNVLFWPLIYRDQNFLFFSCSLRITHKSQRIKCTFSSFPWQSIKCAFYYIYYCFMFQKFWKDRHIWEYKLINMGVLSQCRGLVSYKVCYNSCGTLDVRMFLKPTIVRSWKIRVATLFSCLILLQFATLIQHNPQK